MIVKTLVAVVALAATGVQAFPQALCGAHGSYLKTQTGHNPCDLASYLYGGGVKPTGDSPFPNLEDLGRTSYPVPTAAEADATKCNTLYYNLVSACAACQTSTMTWATWKEWTANCKSYGSMSALAETLPEDVPLPNWAFTPPTATNGTFSALAALTDSEQNIPDSFFPKLVVTATTICHTPKLTPGGIAGVVIGAIAAIALLALVALVARRNKKSKATPNTTLVRTGSGTSSVEGIMRQKPEAV